MWYIRIYTGYVPGGNIAMWPIATEVYLKKDVTTQGMM